MFVSFITQGVCVCLFYYEAGLCLFVLLPKVFVFVVCFITQGVCVCCLFYYLRYLFVIINLVS